MDLRESLKQQIDQLAAELNVAPGYAKNASEETLQKRLAELEEQLPDDDEQQSSEPEQETQPKPEQEPAEQEPAPLLQKGERVTAGQQRITATRTFKRNGEWVKAGETITISAAEAGEHIRAGRAIRQL